MSKQSFTNLLREEKLVLVDFYATWCGPCKTMAPILTETKQLIDGKAKIIKIDVDRNQAVAQQFRVQSVPTLILFKEGKPVWRQVGVVQKEALSNIIHQHS